MRTLKKFKEDIEDFRDMFEMSDSTFGKKALNHPAFLLKLNQGRDVRTQTMDKVYDFMKQYKADFIKKHERHFKDAAE